MPSFGFTIAKFFEFLHEKRGEAQAPRMAPPTVGMLMIAVGLIALLWRACSTGEA